MFIVTLADGSQLVEGTEGLVWSKSEQDRIKNPDTPEVPQGLAIAAVSLVDHGQLAATASGYDYYIVAYEAIASSPSTPDGVVRHPTVTAQKLFAIRNLSIERPSVAETFREINDDLVATASRGEKAGNFLLLRAATAAQKELKERLERLLENMERAEVLEITFGFQYRSYKHSELQQAEAGFRPGLPRAISDKARDTFRAFLMKEDKE